MLSLRCMGVLTVWVPLRSRIMQGVRPIGQSAAASEAASPLPARLTRRSTYRWAALVEICHFDSLVIPQLAADLEL